MADLLGFENFRTFDKEILIDLAPITIITGPNNSGKSSVIKAAKLLKQNTNSQKYSALPEKLSFNADKFGHCIGNLSQAINRDSASEKVSFIVPIHLETLGENFNCKISYNRVIVGESSHELALESFSVFQRLNESKELVNISGQFSFFYEMYINPLLFIECFEKTFLDQLGININSDSFSRASLIFHKEKLSGQDILKELINADKQYVSNEPIMPWFNLFLSENSMLILESYKESNTDLFIIADRVINYYKKELEDYKLSNNISEWKTAVLQYFKNLEQKYFQFIENSRLIFPIDFSLDQREYFWWNGILSYDVFEQEIHTPEENINAIGEYDMNLLELMIVFENSSLRAEMTQENNFEIFNNYVQYVIMESMEKCRQSITEFQFADLNRIEQALVYTDTGSKTSYGIINDYISKFERYNHTQTINSQLRRLGIADCFKIEPANGAYTINLLKEKRWVPLAEMGFGISKIFFCLLALDAYDMVFLEEPESNMHPDLQAKLADILIAFSNKSKKIIIETHSEYLIRKLQYLVATNEIDKENVLIHYFSFNSKNKKGNRVKKIKIKRDGGLDGQFGPGFYDEAANIIRDLFSLTSYN